MKFEDYLAEAGKRFAYSKDGVRKHVKTDREAEAWKQTIAKPPKEAKAKGPSKDENLSKLSRIISVEVGNHYPDSDGWDAIYKQVKKMYPNIKEWEATDLMDKAVKKHLGEKDFSTFVAKFGDDLPSH